MVADRLSKAMQAMSHSLVLIFRLFKESILLSLLFGHEHQSFASFKQGSA
jgi:hypothetical protein